MVKNDNEMGTSAIRAFEPGYERYSDGQWMHFVTAMQVLLGRLLLFAETPEIQSDAHWDG